LGEGLEPCHGGPNGSSFWLLADPRPMLHAGMGTDYDEFRKPCPCGQGTIRVGRSSPDHGWASVYSVHWDANTECLACQQIYVVDGTDAGMRVVRRADVAAVAARRNAYEAACTQFMALPSTADLKRDFADSCSRSDRM
jgi:hypothetical protein